MAKLLGKETNELLSDLLEKPQGKATLVQGQIKDKGETLKMNSKGEI